MLQNLIPAAGDKDILQLAQLKCGLVVHMPVEQIFPPSRLSYLSSSLYFFSDERIVKFATYLAINTFDSIVLSLSANESVRKTIPFCNSSPVISETIFCLISLV